MSKIHSPKCLDICSLTHCPKSLAQQGCSMYAQTFDEAMGHGGVRTRILTPSLGFCCRGHCVLQIWHIHLASCAVAAAASNLAALSEAVTALVKFTRLGIASFPTCCSQWQLASLALGQVSWAEMNASSVLEA